MRKLVTLTFVTVTIFLLTSNYSFGQNIKQVDSVRHQLLSVAREIMTSSGNCALITQDQDGRARVRVMDPFPPENDFTVWFGTNPKSRKVTQIKNDPRVTLYYFDHKASAYVTIHGIAQLVDDPNEKEIRWKEAWKLFYPDKPDGYLLIKVTSEYLEVISESHGITGDPATWKPPIVKFESKD